MRQFFSRPLWLVVGIAVIAAAGYFGYTKMARSGGALEVETVEVENGDVRRIVSTSGSVRALVTVDVGSQLSGQILSLNADYNSVVREGDVIARLDPQTYDTRIRESEASLTVAQSQVQVQEAQLTRAQASLHVAQNEFNRADQLLERGNTTQAAYDTAYAGLQSAQADVRVAEANLTNAQATLGQRQATLDSARIDLDRTVIRSPIDGTVVSREVNVGQTVAASMQAPVLFTIAGDLSKVQIDAQVDEADIGQVRDDQVVNFTVDAYPDSKFEGVVEQIRLAALTESNVVTYTVVISADNPRQRLLPGMTANVDIITGAREDVLTVDNRALRYEPRDDAISLLTADGRRVLASLHEDDNNAGGFPRGGFPPGGFNRGGGGPPGGFNGGGGPPGGFNGGGGNNGQRGGGGFAGGLLGELRTRLDLTDAQVDQVQSAMRSSFQGFQDGGERPDPDSLRTRIASTLESVLTPEQLEIYKDLQSELDPGARATVWVQTASGQLEPRQVRLGVADAEVTEILGDQLHQGDHVVTRVRARTT